MSVQIGAALMVKMRHPNEPHFVTVAGLRARSITLTADPIEATHAQSAGRWRQFLEQSGMRHLRLEGEGVFANSAADLTINNLFFTGRRADCEIVIPSFGRLTGFFMLSGLAYIGHEQGEMLWRMVLQSTDVIEFAHA